MNYSVLVIEDEDSIRKIIVDYLKVHGFSVEEAIDGKDGIDKFEDKNFDLIILDIMMPKIDGWTVCRRIRKNSNIPIIILTARADEDDELMGFELEADDYIKKPFSPAVLIARAKKLLERTNKNFFEEINFNFGLSIDKMSREVKVDEKIIDLTAKEFDILFFLIENENIVLSREKILSHIWGYDFLGDIRVVDNHIKKIRKSLGDKAYYIKTVFGIGYKFEVK